MSYRLAIALNGVLFAGLFIVLRFAPKVYLSGYGIAQTESAEFIARRASPMFFGLAFMMCAIRDLAVSSARRVVTDGTAALLLGISATGLYSLATGAVGPQILAGVFVEVSLAAALLTVRNKAP